MLKSFLEKLLEQQDLTAQESSAATRALLSSADPCQVAAFLALMRAKGETVEELSGILVAMRQQMVAVSSPGPLLDIVGTGGDGAHTINISTGSAILAASCGVKIAKHGNRSVSSLSGSADVLEALGIPLATSASQVEETLAALGIGFMFAPYFHPAMQGVKEVRRALATRTFFNVIGPLLNPASAQHLMVGVFKEDLLHPVATLLAQQKCHHSFVFHGSGLDELSCVGPAHLLEIFPSGEIRERVLDPETLGLPRCRVEDLRGGVAEVNAALLCAVFEGEEGPIADTLILNAGAALYLYGSVKTLKEGVESAREHLKGKKALELLNAWRSFTCAT